MRQKTPADQRSVKLTLTIPAALRKRMRRLDREVNWSALVREAIEKRIDGEET